MWEVGGWFIFFFIGTFRLAQNKCMYLLSQITMFPATIAPDGRNSGGKSKDPSKPGVWCDILNTHREVNTFQCTRGKCCPLQGELCYVFWHVCCHLVGNKSVFIPALPPTSLGPLPNPRTLSTCWLLTYLCICSKDWKCLLCLSLTWRKWLPSKNKVAFGL